MRDEQQPRGRPVDGHDDNGVRNIVAGSTWSAACSGRKCSFEIPSEADRGPAIDAAQAHVRETGHEVTFTAEIVWSLTPVANR